MSAVTWRGAVALVPWRGRAVEVDCTAFAAALGDDIDVIARIVDVDFAQNEDATAALVMRIADHDREVLRACSDPSLTIDADEVTLALTDIAFHDDFRNDGDMRLELGWTEAAT